MNYTSFLAQARTYPLFKVADVQKWFPEADKRAVLNQLHAWTLKGYIERMRRGIYMFRDNELRDPFIIAGFIYKNSYVSIESALNSLGIIPDIPFAVTCVSLAKTKTFRIKNYGVFLYQHIKSELFFGFSTIRVGENYSYNIATPEKALFDYFYLKGGKQDNPLGFLEEMRLTPYPAFNYREFGKWAELVSSRKKGFHILVKTFLNSYGK